jgi:hypothetical protein
MIYIFFIKPKYNFDLKFFDDIKRKNLMKIYSILIISNMSHF